MYGPGAAGYNELYYNTAIGLMAGDPQVKIGGPADSGGNSPYSIPSLIDFAKAHTDIKLDFISYHRYGQDSPAEDVATRATSSTSRTTLYDDDRRQGLHRRAHQRRVGLRATIPSCRATPRRPPASSPSRSTSSAPTRRRALPTMYGYWTLSDIYEEMNTGSATAYREGNYGLLLKGDPNIPASFDVAKPAFNAFRLLHMMTDTIVPVTGGHRRPRPTTASARSPRSPATATRSRSSSTTTSTLRHRHLGGDVAGIDAGVAGRRQPAVHADARAPLRRRPHALELAHGVGRDGQAADAERRPVERRCVTPPSSATTRPPASGGNSWSRDVPAEHLQRVADRIAPVVRQHSDAVSGQPPLLAALLAALPARAAASPTAARRAMPPRRRRRRRCDGGGPARRLAPPPGWRRRPNCPGRSPTRHDGDDD